MFELDLPALERQMVKDGKIQHNRGNKIRLFPFPANDKILKELENDLTTFKGIAGGCFRECLSYGTQAEFDKEAFLLQACETAQAPGNGYLKDILEKVAFDEQDQLIVFNTKVFPHLGHYVKNETLHNISKYLVHVFLDEEETSQLAALAASEPDNLMHRLILTCLPPLRQAESKGEPFFRMESPIRQRFKEDFRTLTGDPAFFAAGFQRLLKLYFFQYVAELTFQLNSFFDERPDRYFFSLSWEKLQASRLASVNGWEVLEKHAGNLFSHVNTLELLNHITGLGAGTITYQGLRQLVSTLNAEEKEVLHAQVEALIRFYAERIPDVNWARFQFKEKYAAEPVFNAVHRLWQMVEFQFQQSTRWRPYVAYRNWFLSFTKWNFTRSRGRNGYSLSLDKEHVLFLTRLCIGHREEKIRLSKLWQELESRGFYLDQLSKGVMVDYFEKINLLEKKSDSGDAQYVRKLR